MSSSAGDSQSKEGTVALYEQTPGNMFIAVHPKGTTGGRALRRLMAADCSAAPPWHSSLGHNRKPVASLRALGSGKQVRRMVATAETEMQCAGRTHPSPQRRAIANK